MKTLELNGAQTAMLKELAKEVKVKTGSTVGFLRDLIISGRRMVERKQDDANTRMEHNNNTIAKRLADEENIKIKADLEQEIASIKETLDRNRSNNLSAKREMVYKNASTVIPDDLFRVMQTLEMRTGEISDFEWDMYNRMFAQNYQGSKWFEEFAGRHGVTIIPANDPIKTIENIDTFDEMCKRTIAVIDDPAKSLYALSFLKDNPDSELATLINEIDTDISALIPAPRRTVLDKLKQAKQHAYDNDDLGLSARIRLFIETHATELATPEDMKDALFERAEELICEGMSVTKK